MTFTRHTKTTRRLVGVALLALLLAQWIALAHAIDHAPRAVQSAHSAQAAHEDGAWAHEADTPDCRLIDQLLIAPLAAAETCATPGFWPATAAEPTGSLPVVCSATLRAYEARGPPRA